jgi:DNA-binding NarL/FixJ family response regulator
VGAIVTIRVLIAVDQRVVREGLRTLLGLVDDVEVVGVAADGDEAVQLAMAHQAEVVLMDLRMPRCDGVEATRRLRTEAPQIKVLVLTTYADDRSVLDALRAGARGYLTKDSGAEEIQHALHQLAQGQAAIDPAVQHHLLDVIAHIPPEQEHAEALPDGLTSREVEVLTLIAQGLTNRQIAERLFVNESTVKTHINHLFAKIGIHDRAQAVTYAYEHGLTYLGDHPIE